MKMDSLQSDYRDMLINVGELVDENKNYLEAMKFRCKSIIKGKENEGINSALDLWTALEKRELIGPNNTAFLKELLNACMKGIMPPMRFVENYEAQAGVQGQQRQHQHNVGFPYPQQQYGPVPPQVVYHVQTSQHAANGLQPPGQENFRGPDLKKEIGFMSKNLGRDWKSLMRQLGVSEATMETIMSEHRSVREQIYQCFLAWQDQEQENASKERLLAALRGIERNDLVMCLEDGNY